MKPLRVLIADDDGVTLMALRKALTSMGHQVVGEAADGEQTLDLARETSPDLAILDIRMPKMEGIEATRMLQQQRPTPVIMLSAHTETGLGSESAHAGAHAYIVKPFTAEQIKLAIELALTNFERECALQQELQRANQALAERKVIERAKGILMRQTGLEEDAAYLRLQKTARSENKKIVEIANALILADQLRRDSVRPTRGSGHPTR